MNIKKIILINILILCNLVKGQNKSNDYKKFHFGVNYSLNYDDALYKNPVISTASYRIINLKPINLHLGIRGFYQSYKIPNVNDSFALNPLILGSYEKINKFHFYLGLGYYFRNNTFNFAQTPFGYTPPIQIKTTGLTVSLGVKYFVIPNLFCDLNYTYLNLKEKLNTDLYIGEDYAKNTLNVGVGLAF